MQFRSILSVRALGAAVLAAVLAVTVMPVQPAAAAPSRVKPQFFGMHDFDPTSWPQAPVGSIRLWDSGVSWREIETRPGTYDFTRLDAQVAAARANRADVLLVLGQTPRFHSRERNQIGSYGYGAAAMPRKEAWQRYVRSVVRRYRGRGVDYQVWNEANVAGYWQGSPRQMAKLTKWSARVVDRIDPAATLVAPALATRLTGQRAWLRAYYAQRLKGRRVATFVDVVSLNLYPLPAQGPEASMRLLGASRTMLGGLGVRKPVWNTEINYGLLGGGTAENISRAKEASFVSRTLVLNADANVKRLFWYGWDLARLANTQLTFANGTSATRAGRAYRVTQGWLKGTTPDGCSRDGRGTYTCTFRSSDGVKRVYWNPSRRASVRVVASATRRVALSGTVSTLSGGERLRVTKMPIMVRSRR